MALFAKIYVKVEADKRKKDGGKYPYFQIPFDEELTQENLMNIGKYKQEKIEEYTKGIVDGKLMLNKNAEFHYGRDGVTRVDPKHSATEKFAKWLGKNYNAVFEVSMPTPDTYARFRIATKSRRKSNTLNRGFASMNKGIKFGKLTRPQQKAIRSYRSLKGWVTRREKLKS